MAAPSKTDRTTPTGVKLHDGYSTKITIAADADIDFWEKTGGAPGMEGGDPIDQTTMFDTGFKPKRARQLKDLTSFTATVAYDPAAYSQISAVINVETTITVTYADGHQLAFFGWLRSFIPGELVEGEQPEATITIEPTPWDSTNSVNYGTGFVGTG